MNEGNVGDKLMHFNGQLRWVSETEWRESLTSEAIEQILKDVWQYGINKPDSNGMMSFHGGEE